MKIPHKISLQKSKAAGIEEWMDGGGCGGKMARHTKIIGDRRSAPFKTVFPHQK